MKQLNIEEQVATVGLVIEKDEAEVEAIAQTIQDDYPNMYLQAKEYGRNLTLACAELLQAELVVNFPRSRFLGLARSST